MNTQNRVHSSLLFIYAYIFHMHSCIPIFANPTYRLTWDSPVRSPLNSPSIKTCLQLTRLGLCYRFASSRALHSKAREGVCTAVPPRPCHFFIQDSCNRQSRAACFGATSLFDLHHSVRLSSPFYPLFLSDALSDLIPEILP